MKFIGRLIDAKYLTPAQGRLVELSIYAGASWIIETGLSMLTGIPLYGLLVAVTTPILAFLRKQTSDSLISE